MVYPLHANGAMISVGIGGNVKSGMVRVSQYGTIISVLQVIAFQLPKLYP